MWADDGAQTAEDDAASPGRTPPTPAGPPSISWPLTSFANTIQNVCCISFLLGFALALNTASFFSASSHNPHSLWPTLNAYSVLLIAFHLLEFLTTAIFNPSRVTVDSFLLNNGASYWFAQLFSTAEYLLREKYMRSFPTITALDKPLVRSVGLAIAIAGQAVRTLAMITAANSFNHRVSTHHKKQDDHALVTNGIYSFLRHPSYFGFFWWSIGIQLFLANPLSLLIFSFVLWSFFNARIQTEELHLIKFFGQAYVDYRSTTSTRIPFIK